VLGVCDTAFAFLEMDVSEGGIDVLRRRGVWGCTYSLPLLPSFLVLSTKEMVAVLSPLLSLAIFK